MRANMLLGWGVLALALVLVATALAYVAMPHAPAHRRLHCHQWVAGPTPVYVCSDGHAYARQGHVLVDLGTNSPYGGGSLPTR